MTWITLLQRRFSYFFIFSKQGKHAYANAIKFIIYYAKYYIYVSCCKQWSLFLNPFNKQLKFMHKVHQYIASKNKVFDTFQKEWSQYQLSINDII